MSESTTSLAGRARPARPQAVLAVLHREWLSPHTVRITAGGPGFDALRMNDFTSASRSRSTSWCTGTRGSPRRGRRTRSPATSWLAYLETSDPGEYLDATAPSGVEVIWLHRPEPGRQPRLLADALLAGPWLSGRADVFAHGERESMKAVRAALKARTGNGDQLSLSGYWAAGRTEDVFQSEKRQPIGQI